MQSVGCVQIDRLPALEIHHNTHHTDANERYSYNIVRYCMINKSHMQLTVIMKTKVLNYSTQSLC